MKTNGSNAARLPRREYGRTGVRLSIIGMGGIVVKGMEQERANRVVAEAVGRGVNYFDVAPSYGDAELRFGPALQPYRKDIFLAVKTGQRTREAAAAELEQSLERLRTDMIDLYQLHSLTNVERDVDVAFGKGGAMETLLEAKRSGRIRFLGFSAHTTEAALAALDRYDFDSVLFPVTFGSWFRNNFGPAIMEKAAARGAARLALKAMARQRWPGDDPRRRDFPNTWYQPITERREADLALRFTLSQPITAAIPPGVESLFHLALDIAADFRPITPDETAELRALSERLVPIMPAA